MGVIKDTVNAVKNIKPPRNSKKGGGRKKYKKRTARPARNQGRNNHRARKSGRLRK